MRGSLHFFLLHLYGVLGANIGEVRLINVTHPEENPSLYEGQAQIYITDGKSPARWSSICKPFNVTEYQVFCRHLGSEYSFLGNAQPKEYRNVSTLMSQVNCSNSNNKKYLNLLQCHYVLDEILCSDLVHLVCQKEVRNHPEGQLTLCGPDAPDSPTVVNSVSYGIVAISLHNQWRALGNHTITVGASDLAELACVSLGFQKAVPGRISTAKTVVNQYSFTKCLSDYSESTWIYLTDLVDCIDTPYPCLGCCLRYRTDYACTANKNCGADFIIIECSYDLFEKHGRMIPSEDACFFGANAVEGDKIENYTSLCTQETEVTTGHRSKAYGILLGIFLISFIVLALTNFIYCIYRRRARIREYENLDAQRQGD